jgi:hypothetical protein
LLAAPRKVQSQIISRKSRRMRRFSRCRDRISDAGGSSVAMQLAVLRRKFCFPGIRVLLTRSISVCGMPHGPPVRLRRALPLGDYQMKFARCLVGRCLVRRCLGRAT